MSMLRAAVRRQLQLALCVRLARVRLTAVVKRVLATFVGISHGICRLQLTPRLRVHTHRRKAWA